MQWWKVIKWQFSYSSLRVLQTFEQQLAYLLTQLINCTSTYVPTYLRTYVIEHARTYPSTYLSECLLT